MARPERNNVDYFPFLCKEGKAMFYIEQKYGNDGYATWVKLLRQLAITNNHFLNLSNKVELMWLSSKCKVSEETLLSIINDLCDLGEFQVKLWSENQIVWSDKLTDSIKDAYYKRNNKIITYQGLLILLDSLGVRKLSKEENYTPNKPQSKEEKSKEEKSRVKRDETFENSVLAFFGFSETTNFNHARTLSDFITVITDQGRLEYFKTQFQAYKQVKILDDMKFIFAFKNYLGDQREKFENGLWDSENWVEKLAKLTPKSETNPVPAAAQGFVLGQKPRGAVNHAK